MTIDVAALRAQFPALSHGTAHFDGPGGSQVPEPVAAAIAATLTSPLANRGQVTEAERISERAVHDCRQAAADLLGADPGGVIFGRSMTALTFDLSRALAKQWGPDDEIAVSRLDHDANIRPWVYAAEAAGATVRWIEFDPQTAEVTVDDVEAAIGDRTRLVALTGASNLIGTRPELARIAARVHEAGGLFYVDGVHLSAHAPVDVDALGADFFACSPYKFLGPHCGIVAAAPQLLESITPDKLLPSTNDVPERFELGTLPYELMAGTTAAIDFLAGIDAMGGTRRENLVASLTAVEAHEDRLRVRIEACLAELPGVTVHSRAAHRTPTLLITFAGSSVGDAYRFLATRGVNAPAGSFYALEASRRLRLGDTGGLRIGLAPYNDDDDVDRLLDGLRRFTTEAR